MPKTKIAINGMGRIGRCLLRLLFARDDLPLEVVAVNNPGDPEPYLHLLQYDSVHAHFANQIEPVKNGRFAINGQVITFFDRKNPDDIPWGKSGAEIVIDASGKFKDRKALAAHLGDSVRKVIMCAPGKDLDATFVMGINHHTYKPDEHHVVSNASCTTNCLAPVAQVVHQSFGITSGLMNTIHAYTSDQRILDGAHKDLRRARAAALSMIPTTTGAARAVGLVIPELAGKLDGFAIRVPTPNVSLVDLSCQLSKTPATGEEVNRAFEVAAASELAGILKCESAPLVSSDFVGMRESACVDLAMTKLTGDLLKVIAWYDNEMGFSHRVLELAAHMGHS